MNADSTLVRYFSFFTLLLSMVSCTNQLKFSLFWPVFEIDHERALNICESGLNLNGLLLRY